jgi:DNA-binding transcriptional LysR family regulator
MRATEYLEMATFLDLAERRSFAEAARHLDVAVSTVSHRIRSLEERLGVRLFDRTTRSVALTPAGEHLLHELEPSLRRLESARDAVEPFRDRAAGHLRLTLAPPAAASVIGPVVARFLASHPEITMEVSVDGASVDIVRDRFDAGVRLGTFLDQDMVALRLGPPVPAVVVASPEYLARKGRPQTPADLSAHDCIRIRVPSGALLPWWFQSGGEIFDAAVDGPLVVNDRELELRIVLDGGGVAHTLSNRLGELVANGRLVSLLEDWLPPPFEFFLYHSSRRQVRPALRALISFLRSASREAAGQ